MNQVQEILLSLLTHIQTVCTSMQIPCVLAGEQLWKLTAVRPFGKYLQSFYDRTGQ